MTTEEDLQSRFGYHRATSASAPQHAAVRQECLGLALRLQVLLPEGRDKALALTALQETMHWANSAIAMENDVDTETAHLPNVDTDQDTQAPWRTKPQGTMEHAADRP